MRPFFTPSVVLLSALAFSCDKQDGISVHTEPREAAPAPQPPATMPAAATTPTQSPGSAADNGISFTLPADWKQVQPSSNMRLMQFSAGDGAQACEVAITCFPGAVGAGLGGTLSNLNRWRGQLELPQWKELPAAPQAVGMTISGHPGAMVQVAAKEGEPASGQAMLVAFVADGQNTFFIKLTGPTAGVESQLLPMIAFLKSLKLPLDSTQTPLPADLRLLPKIGK